VERYTASDKSLAPAGEELIQAQMPGLTWRERPAIDRGDGVYLAGDMVAAPGCLSEIAWASAIEASKLAVAAAGGGKALRPAATAGV
jgi:hypothetical protein